MTRRRRGKGIRPTPQAARPDPSAARRDRAFRHASSIVLFLAIAAAGVLADLLTKHYAFAALTDRPRHMATVIPDLLNLRLSTNPGIVFGLSVPLWIVLPATLTAMAAVTLMFATSRRGDRWLHAALAMVLAGAIGNAYDRLFSRVVFAGGDERIRQVRDFIDCHIGDRHWPTFNVADILLVVGVGLILLHSFRGHKAGAKA